MLSLIDRLRRLAGRSQTFKRRFELLNHLIKQRGYQRYLEIGVFRGACFRRIRCAEKVGVDPQPLVVEAGWTVHQMPSDDFFAANCQDFDLVFIDGLHLAEQVFRDVVHSLAVLRPGGMILLHDCNPVAEENQIRSSAGLAEDKKWNGDAWKAFAFFRSEFPAWFTRVLNIDEGLGIVIPPAGAAPPKRTPALEAAAARIIEQLDYRDLERDRTEMLGLTDDWSTLEQQILQYLTAESQAA